MVQEIPLLDDGAIDVERLKGAFDEGTQVFLLANPHNGYFRGPSWSSWPTCVPNAGWG